jgi:hypothetical protein
MLVSRRCNGKRHGERKGTCAREKGLTDWIRRGAPPFAKHICVVVLEITASAPGAFGRYQYGKWQWQRQQGSTR